MGKQEGVDEPFEGRHYDREVIILCVRWYLDSETVSEVLSGGVGW